MDEFTKAAIAGTRIGFDLPESRIGFLSGGMFAIAGYLERVFPQFPTVPATLTLAFSAAGYQQEMRDVAMSTNLPVAAGTVALRPEPVRLQGRVINRSTRDPLPGATIAPTTTKVTFLGAPANFRHSVGAGVVEIRRCTLTTGHSDSLAAPAPAGATRLTLQNVGPLAAPAIVRIGPAGRREYAQILNQPPGTNDIVVTTPTHRAMPSGAPVVEVVPTTTTTTNAVTQSIYRGESVVSSNATTVIAGPVRISSASGVEYHDAGPVVADSQGYYVFDGFGGLASVELKGKSGALEEIVTAFVNYSDPVNHLDFRLK